MTNARILKSARLDFNTLTHNELYNFSLGHALSIYPLNAIYTFIPKNACSSLRFSIAVANGFLKTLTDIDWINKNNQTFIPTQRESILAKYTFVVLRCPFRRVASCFLDKIVDRKIEFNDENGLKVNVNFNDFLSIIKSQNRFDRDEHWRNQTDFLHYESYDDYFSLELFKEATNSLTSQGLNVYDTREVLQHDLSMLKKIDGDFSKTNQDKIKEMKANGSVPDYRSMFSSIEIELVKDIYSDDIELYKTHCGGKELLF